MESRGNWTDLIAGVGLQIAEVFDQGQEEYLPGISAALISTTAGAVAQANYTGKTGSGKLKKFDDGDDISQTKRYKTYLTKVVYNNYGQYVEVTKNTIEDREFSAQLDEMKDISIAANYSQDESGIQLFNGGFATTVTVNGYDMTWYGDGQPLFSTVHATPVPGASTNSNASATSIPFGHDALEIARIALVEQKTDDGQAMSMMGKMAIVVPPSLEREAKEETESQLTPESAENAINVFKGTFDVISTTFLAASNGGSNTAWFVIIPGKAKIYHEVRQSPRLEKEVNIKNKVATFTVDARWADYVRDWRRSWGSKGDNSAYSS